MSAGGDVTRGDNRSGDGGLDKRCGLGIWNDLGEREGDSERRRCGVGDIGDDARWSLGGVIITGE